MSPASKDGAASVKQRLLNWSSHEHVDFQQVLTRYGIERFVLKGAMLFIAWEGWSPRPTRDVDLLGRGESSPDLLKSMFEAVCLMDVEPYGLVFDPATVHVTDIREDQEYGGQRVRLRATLGPYSLTTYWAGRASRIARLTRR